MNVYWYYPNGKIFQSGSGITESSLQFPMPGMATLAVANLVEDINDYYIENEQVVAKPPSPSPAHEFNYDTKEWVDPRSLEEQQLQQWELIKISRDAALSAPLTTPYGVFDADPVSQKNITDAIALMQMLEAQGTPQTIEFTLYDDSVVTLTTQQMVEVGVALGVRTQEIYAISRDLRTQLDAATNLQEVEAVVWPT